MAIGQESVVAVGALDKLLAQALASIIREKLGDKTYQKIESRLQERYGLAVLDAIKEFHTLDATLREFFGPGADAVEDDFLNRLISFQSPTKGRRWVTIENQDLSNLILESYGEKEKRLILETAFNQPGVIQDILEACNIPKSSGYRLINELVEDGLLTEEGHAETSDGKRVTKYTTLFEKTKIDIESGKLTVQVLLKENVLIESNIVRVLLRRGK